MSDLADFDSLWDYDDPAGTEQRFRALLPTAAAAGDPAYGLELETQIARTQGLQRDFAGAHATLDGVAARLPAGPTPARVRYLLERGRVFNSAGQVDQAVPLFEAALALAVETGADFHAVDAAHMLGIAASPDARLAWNLHALDLAEASPDPRAQAWRGSLYNNLGWTYHDAGDYTEALALFERALACREATGPAREIRISRWMIGRALRSLGRLDEALALQEALRAEWAALGETAGWVDAELGECLLSLGRSAEAAPHFAAAYRALAADPWLVAREPDRLARLQARGAGAESAPAVVPAAHAD